MMGGEDIIIVNDPDHDEAMEVKCEILNNNNKK